MVTPSKVLIKHSVEGTVEQGYTYQGYFKLQMVTPSEAVEGTVKQGYTYQQGFIQAYVARLQAHETFKILI